jgi:hypothetical protein
VLPTVETINDRYLTAEDLSKLPKIGESSASDVGDLSTYLMGRTFAFVSPEHREDSGVLHLFEPSKVLRDESDTDYIARVSDAQAAHKPATLAEVEPGVRADVVSAKAYEQARADAQKLYEKAKEGSLKEIGGSSVITAGPILNRPGPIPGYPISGNAADVFIPEVFKLVSTAPAKPSVKPTTLIEIPTAEKAIVAQLQDVSPLFNTNTMPLEAARLRMTMSNQLTQLLGQRWFDYQTVAQRTHYVPDPAYQKEEPTGPSEPRPPVQPPIF